MYMLMRGKLMEKNYLNDEGSRDAREADVFEKFGEVALATVDVTTYPGADHGYTWPGYPTYDQTAAETSWAKTLAMFGTALT